MKIISYSLFGSEKFTPYTRLHFMTYLRGFYWNCRMNKLIYPDWDTVLNVDHLTYIRFRELFEDLKQSFGVRYVRYGNNQPASKAMLQRLRPIWSDCVTHCIARDADAITTYREAQAVQAWLDSEMGVHMILDHPCHIDLMGGMIGFKTEVLRKHFPSWEALIEHFDFSNRGGDQDLMNQRIAPLVQDDILWHVNTMPTVELPGVDPMLSESNSTCRHIGSSGVLESETIQFFHRFDPNPELEKLESKYPKIFYWRL